MITPLRSLLRNPEGQKEKKLRWKKNNLKKNRSKQNYYFELFDKQSIVEWGQLRVRILSLHVVHFIRAPVRSQNF